MDQLCLLHSAVTGLVSQNYTPQTDVEEINNESGTWLLNLCQPCSNRLQALSVISQNILCILYYLFFQQLENWSQMKEENASTKPQD
jgi:hypothetical protein